MINRRNVLLALPALAATALGETAAAAEPEPAARAALASLPAGARVPQLQFTYECDVTLSEALDFGTTLEGHRRVIPITGGSFGGPALRGSVIPGAVDWNLARSDGAGSVDAAYFLRTDDNVLIRVVNRGVSLANRPAAPATGERFSMFTVPVFEAPAGKYDWMNRAVFVATLGGRAGVTNAVLIRVFQLV